MLAIPRRPAPLRRGVTLVEMLVVVALVVLMMTILVQIFQSATGAMTSSRTIQELDLSLRLLDTTIRQDLQGATARFTPPLNPANNLGYFEYSENAFADPQGEDGDDFLAFTTRAPEGQVFTGRQWLGFPGSPYNQKVQPTTITSPVAEVIYFLRNGNLYRRTFLVVPERAKSLVAGNSTSVPNTAANGSKYFDSYMFGPKFFASWLGMNDISARPTGFDTSGLRIPPLVMPNTLGDLTNRENRAFHPRFFDDFGTDNASTGVFANGTPDGKPDDHNGDDIPDYYPTLYFDGGANKNNNNGVVWAPNGHVVEGYVQPVTPTPDGRVGQTGAAGYQVYAFPFIYPGMYSVPEIPASGPSLGWLHYMYPNVGNNHSPLELGDDPLNTPTGNQTWFGFPTWRETVVGYKGVGDANAGWTDPIVRLVPTNLVQPPGLRPFDPTTKPLLTDLNFPTQVFDSAGSTPFKYDTAGSASFLTPPTGILPGAIWEDDLILTNVRSFDVKAYDPDATLYIDKGGTPYNKGAGYYDLGYADYFSSGKYSSGLPNLTDYQNNNYLFQPFGGEPSGFGHQGRIPPVFEDYRFHPLRKSYNLGDNSAGVIRLRRTFDTWSTAYTNAPASDVYLNGLPTTLAPFNNPIYPSFPAPYPSALRGIQIQIRVADPRGERVKVLTIRQDFTDKL